MKRAIIPINAHSKGLVPNQNVRNVLYLTESIGSYPYEGVLIACEDYSANQIDCDALGCSFPYPQIFILSEIIVVCTQTAIYEYDGSLNLKISGLTPGVLWSVADYKTYIAFTNGQVRVKKDPDTGAYSIDSTEPYGSSIADFNGQIILTCPLNAVSGNI